MSAERKSFPWKSRLEEFQWQKTRRERSNGGSAYHLRVQNNRGNFGGSDVFDTLGQMGL